jgi:hypothetical protein
VENVIIILMTDARRDAPTALDWPGRGADGLLENM